MKMPLSQLNPGKKATITSAEKTNHMLLRRLIDFGVIEGSEIIMVKRLPFGGPLAIEYNGQLIGLRKKDASLIEVEAL